MPDYTAWPTPADIDITLDACAVTLRPEGWDATTLTERHLAAVTAEVGRLTRRQFVADASDTTRTYDGSGTAEQDVDEMVSLTSVTVVGSDGDTSYAMSGVALVSEQGLPASRLVVDSGSSPGVSLDDVFPSGRQNLRVTGKFGYAPSIPPDLWEAVAGEVAHRLACEVGWRPTGRVKARQVGDARTDYQHEPPSATGWHERYLAAVRQYERPTGRRARRLRPPMV